MATRLARGCLAGLAVACCGCQPPTEVTVVITTSAPCPHVDDTAIIVGNSSKDVETRDPATVTSLCTNGSIGSIVIVPAKNREAAFAVKVVTGVGALAEDCVKGLVANVPGAATGCIYARRELGFIPETPLVLPIVMHVACIGVDCGPGETCVETGACASAMVNPASCAEAGGCGETALGSASGTGGGGASSSSHGSSGGMGGGPVGPSSSTGGFGGMNAASSSSSSSHGSSGAGGTGPSSSSSSHGSSGAGGTGPSSSSSSSAGVGGMTGSTGHSSSSSSNGGTGGASPGTSGSSSGVVPVDSGLMTDEAGAG